MGSSNRVVLTACADVSSQFMLAEVFCRCNNESTNLHYIATGALQGSPPELIAVTLCYILASDWPENGHEVVGKWLDVHRRSRVAFITLL